MKTTILTIATAVGLGLIAGCDRKPETRTTATPPAAPAGSGATGAQSNTPTTPANAGTPNAAEKKEGANPVQGQVDPKQPAQQKDFQQPR